MNLKKKRGPMYNLLEYSDNCFMKLGSLWNYYRDEVNHDDNYRINNSKTTASKSFEYKTKLIGSKPDNNSRLYAEVVVPLKYLSNFWRSLDLPLINCEIQLDLPRSKNCVISEVSRASEVDGDNQSGSNISNWCNISNK